MTAASPPVAVLGMYPFREARHGFDLLWKGVHRRLPWTPPLLDWSIDPHSSWYEPGLCLGQACGWPVVTELRGVVRVVGTFAHAIAQANEHRYRSVVLARRDGVRVPGLADFAGRAAAVNTSRSMSGWISLIHAVHGPGSTWAGPVVWTGAHVESVHAVRQGRADVMSIDSVTLAMLRRDEPEALDGLVEVGVGPEVPALPLVTRWETSDEEIAVLRHAITEAFAESSEIGAGLFAHRFVAIDSAEYQPILAFGPSRDGTPVN